MKFFYSHTKPAPAALLYKESPETRDTHDKIASGVESVSKAPLRLVDMVSDGVHNTLKKVPLLKVVPYITHPIVKGVVNGANGVVGGTLNTASHLTTNTISGAGKIVAGAGKGLTSYVPYSKAQKANEDAADAA
jgi:hypothetical protein